ncbi:cyanobacterial porin [Thalassoporum mexicanum PCC 7367]|uniref:iron uptake porin n=1 Tax=Thalassoporum mexicanum TaxID=3457544 RepID=UPI00029F9F3E|nr:iron uptake porin [Pseudanabaena sp. PCC 7367]AFY69644.1 cyanobacterial porin [Pseudanabaena sp. PCC 7367]
MKKFNLSLAGSVGLIAIATSAGVAKPATAETTTVSQTEEVAQVVQQVNSDLYFESNPAFVSQGVTSVSQLSDVQPTDWAFTALQSLVERYGCIAGYPDRTYRGQRAMTRYEFAAGLNACLDKINEIIASGLADKVSKEDLAALQRLQEEFAAELAALRGRVDALEAKTAQLEAQQFSTTTKLEGEAILSLTGASASSTIYGSDVTGGNPFSASVIADDGDTNVTFNARVRLNFNTSFTGDDLLITRLEAGNGGSGPNFLGSAPPGDTGNLGFDTFGQDFAGVQNSFNLAKLRYDFNVFSEDFRVSIGPVMHVYDHIDANSYANDEASDFSSTFFINNPLMVLINPLEGGAGAAIDWNPKQGAFSFRALYLAANGADPTDGANIAGFQTNRGLTGDPYQGSVELEYAPPNEDGDRPFAIRLQYTAGSISNLDIDAGGVNVEWAFSERVAFFGRYGFGSIDSRNGVPVSLNPSLSGFVNPDTTDDSISPQTYMVGLAFPDLFREGSMAAIAYGSPFIDDSVGDSTQSNLEAFYRFPISDNIHITPDVQVIFNPNNNSANDTIFVGTLRTTFSF